MKTLVLGRMPKDATPETHLASGPWCFCGQEEIFPNWERRFSFAPEPLASASRLPETARAAQCLCVRLIPDTAKMLTKDCDKLPPDYWQILLAPFLIDLACQIVERSLRCQAMLDTWGQEELMVPILPSDCSFNFVDEQDFTLRGALGEAYNHWLFSRLLDGNWPAKWQRRELDAIDARKGRPRKRVWQMRNLLVKLALKLPFPIMKGMTAKQALRLSAALRHPLRGLNHSLNLEKTFGSADALEKIPLPGNLNLIVEKSLPESLKRLSHNHALKKTATPRLRIASLAFHENAAYRQKLAIWRAAGNRIAHSQHGGNYGIVETPCAAEIIEYSQDAFFTWGWTSQGRARGNFVPLPSLQLSGELSSWQRGEKLVFTGAEMAAYPYRLHSRPTPLQFVAYRKAKADFLEALGSALRKQTLYRPYFPVPGTLADADWLMPKFPEIQPCNGSLLTRIQHCRLLVLDHHGTTLLEALAAGVPFICYWQRESWPLCDEGAALLEGLEKAGIWHSTPQGAAEKARKIWDDPESWLQTDTVKTAREIFAGKQALAEPDSLHKWLKALERL